LILQSKINDFELGWGISNKKENKEINMIHRISKDKIRSYYFFRNGVFFEINNNLVNNKKIFWVNMVTYLLIIFLFNRDLSVIRIAIKAIKDGYKGKLGKVEDKQLK